MVASDAAPAAIVSPRTLQARSELEERTKDQVDFDLLDRTVTDVEGETLERARKAREYARAQRSTKDLVSALEEVDEEPELQERTKGGTSPRDTIERYKRVLEMREEADKLRQQTALVRQDSQLVHEATQSLRDASAAEMREEAEKLRQQAALRRQNSQLVHEATLSLREKTRGGSDSRLPVAAVESAADGASPRSSPMATPRCRSNPEGVVGGLFDEGRLAAERAWAYCCTGFDPGILLHVARSAGVEGDAAGEFSGPWDVAALADGGVVVSDGENNRLQLLARAPGTWRTIGSSDGGDGPGEFTWPRGVCCVGDEIYVSEEANNRVQKLRLADGAHLASIGGEEGDGEGQFSNPASLCYVAGTMMCRLGTMYVCDRDNNRVVALGMDLKWRHAFGREGDNFGEFRHSIAIAERAERSRAEPPTRCGRMLCYARLPTCLAQHGGELYVTDAKNHRVQAAPCIAHASRHAHCQDCRVDRPLLPPCPLAFRSSRSVRTAGWSFGAPSGARATSRAGSSIS